MNRLKELRAERMMRQADLAELLHVKTATISRYEVGQRDIDTETLRALCEIFGVTADYLLGFSDFRTAEISPEDRELLEAYRAAPPEIRDIVDAALDRYRKKENTAAG